MSHPLPPSLRPLRPHPLLNPSLLPLLLLLRSPRSISVTSRQRTPFLLSIGPRPKPVAISSGTSLVWRKLGNSTTRRSRTLARSVGTQLGRSSTSRTRTGSVPCRAWCTSSRSTGGRWDRYRDSSRLCIILIITSSYTLTVWVAVNREENVWDSANTVLFVMEFKWP